MGEKERKKGILNYDGKRANLRKRKIREGRKSSMVSHILLSRALSFTLFFSHSFSK